MGITYKLLASATTTSTTTSFALTNIPQQYTDLLIEISARSSGTDSIVFYAQPYGYGYAQKGLYGNSSTFTGYNYMGNYGVDYIGTLPSSSDTADVFGTYRIYIPNYSDSTSAKPYSSYGVSESATSTAYHEFTTHYFPSTSPIEAFNISGNSVGLATGSTISVYGISNVDSSSSPSAPTISQVKAGHSSATVYFTETADTTSYEVTTSPGNSKTYGTKSPIQVKRDRKSVV